MSHNSMEYENEARFKQLADRLRAEIPLSDPNWNDAQTIITRCEDNTYHDFLSPDEAPEGTNPMNGPKMQMVEDLRKIGWEDEAQRVINGDYDQ